MEFRVDGMTCGNCVGRIQRAIEESVPSDVVTAVSLKEGIGIARLTNVQTSDYREIATKAIGAVLNAGKSAAFSANLSYGFHVEGMTCKNCVAKVKEHLGAALPNVGLLSVSLTERGGRLEVVGVDLLDSVALAEDVVTELFKIQKQAKLERLDKRFQVGGMSCQSCVRAVETCLREIIPEQSYLTVTLEDGKGEAVIRGIPADDAFELQNSVESALRSIGKALVIEQAAPHVVKEASPVDQAQVGEACLVDIPVISSEPDQMINERSSHSETESEVVTHVRVEGMTCASCVSKVEEIIRKVPGVVEVQVSLISSKAMVRHCGISVSTIVETIENAGYDSGVITLSQDNNDVNLLFDYVTEAEEATAALSEDPRVAPDSIAVVRPARLGSMNGSDRSCTCFGGLSGKTEDTRRIVRFQVLPRKGQARNGRFDVVKALRHSGFSFRILSRSDALVTGQHGVGERLREESRQWLSAMLLAIFFFVPQFIISSSGPHASLMEPIGDSDLYKGELLSFALTTPIQFICGYHFYRNSYFALFRRGRANMDVLVALSSSLSYFVSLALIIHRALSAVDDEPRDRIETVFGTSAMLITFVLIGKWLESAAKSRAADGVSLLAKLRPVTANLVEASREGFVTVQSNVEVELLDVGDFVRVPAGDPFPADGVVVEGTTSADESTLTGESQAIAKEVGDCVYSGTCNKFSAVVVRVSCLGSDTVLSQIEAAIEASQAKRAPIESIADRIAGIFVPFTIATGGIVFLVWFALSSLGFVHSEILLDEGPAVFSLMFALSVMVIACPCALGLATPTAVMVACGLAANRFGILLKGGGDTLQKSTSIRHIVFDKTGTLTVGNPEVRTWLNLRDEELGDSSVDNKKEYDLIASAEICSEHPVGHAIVDYLKRVRGAVGGLPVKDVEIVAGNGIRSYVNGYRVVIGSSEWVLAESAAPPKASRAIRDLEENGMTVAVAAIDGQVAFACGIDDQVRPGAQTTIRWLQAAGYQCWLVTGDGPAAASRVAKDVKIPENNVFSRSSPVKKAEILRKVRQDSLGGGVVFAGDGINDGELG